MAGRQPVAEEPVNAGDTMTTGWADGQPALEQARSYWLATSRLDGGAHVRPVLGVWVDGALYFAVSPRSRKARNLERDPRCVFTTRSGVLDLVMEGAAGKVRDDGRLRCVADAYASKYEWSPTVRDGAFHDVDGAPTAGPPPYEVYEITATTVFGFPLDDTVAPTRWRV
jgi:nitroimidazol reductase NimA-like FMN-containing flavoprotein (pyridoxamine 5'-phosphate oxidase superfamily)